MLLVCQSVMAVNVWGGCLTRGKGLRQTIRKVAKDPMLIIAMADAQCSLADISEVVVTGMERSVRKAMRGW